MRMKNIDVLRAFVDGALAGESHTGNLFIAGNKLFNYSTCIAERVSGGGFIVNITRYSRTTSTIQNKLLYLLENSKVEKVSNVPIGARVLADHVLV